MDYLDIEVRGRDEIKKFQKIVLFGAGSYLSEVLKSFRGYNIVAIFDNYVDLSKGQEFEGIPVLRPRDCLHDYVDGDTAIVMGVCSNQYEIACDLVENYHVNRRQVFSMCADYQEERMYDAEAIRGHVKDLEYARSILCDEESRQFLDNAVRLRLTHDPLFLKPNPHIVGKYVYRENELERIMPQKGDIIIDGGAFIGDTAKFFLDVTEGDCLVHCFEPFPGNFAILTKMVRTRGLQDKVKIYNLALGDREDVVRISAEEEVSPRANRNVDERNATNITRKKLDDLEDEIGHVGFIKLDIEGDEKNALMGGANVIRKCKPRMMVSAYHKCADLWELPALLHEINPEYRIYLGHQPYASFEPEFYVG